MERYKNKPTNKQRSSVDGMLATGPRRSAGHNVANQKPANGVNLQRQRQLDDFSQKDGFYGRSNQRLATDSSFEQRLADSNEKNRHSNPSVKATINFGGNRGRGSGNRSKNGRPKKKRSINWKLFRKISIFAVIAVIGLTGLFFGKAWWDASRALKGGGDGLALSKDVDPYSLNGEGDGRVNILLMGKGGESHEGGQLTDTLMVASLDPVNNGVVLLSIPRDLWVKPDGLWPMKINAVYNSAKGQHLYENPDQESEAESVGIAATEKVVEDYMGIKVNYYGMVDFTAFEEAVNILGGVTVNLPEAYSDPTMLIGKKYLSLEAGPNELDGGHALGFARSRYGAERGDFDRGRNQQLVMIGIKDKVLSMGTFVNPIKINQLISTFGNRVNTNFSVDDLMRLYEVFKQIPNENITNVDLAMEGEAVVTTGNIGGQSVVYPVAGIDDFSEVQKFVRLKLKDGFIIKENPSIVVLNASGKTGAATKRAEELKSYGYNVIQVADATTTDLEYTQLVDNNDGAKKYTKRYLELRFDTTAVKAVDGLDLSPYIADYIVVIGKSG